MNGIRLRLQEGTLRPWNSAEVCNHTSKKGLRGAGVGQTCVGIPKHKRIQQKGFISGVLALLLFRGAAPAGAAAVQPAHDTFPFVPLLKIKSMSAAAATIVPYEPTVPGQQTSHYTVAAHSAYGWFSPWQVRPHMSHLLLASVLCGSEGSHRLRRRVHACCASGCAGRGMVVSTANASIAFLINTSTHSERTTHVLRLALV